MVEIGRFPAAEESDDPSNVRIEWGRARDVPGPLPGDPERGRDINGMVCRLPDSSGRLVAEEDIGQPPFPTGPAAADGCGRRYADSALLADAVGREVLARMRPLSGLFTYASLALAPREWIPPYRTGTPQGIFVDSDGNLHHTDLDLKRSGWSVDTGPNGRVWRITLDAVGTPLAPEFILEGLAFPDGLGVLPGDLEN